MKMKTMNIFFANVRTSIALGIVCMLLFAVVSCDKVDDPFEYEETEEVPCESTQPEIPDIFSSRFRISNNSGRFLMFDQLSPGLVVEPINLPEDFQTHQKFAQATVSRIGEEVNESGNSIVKITLIQETDLRDGRFFVQTNSEGEYILVWDNTRNWGDWREVITPALSGIIPTNLPEEFQQDGLHVQVIFRYMGEGLPMALFSTAEIVEIREVGVSAQTRITGGWSVDIERAPWQAKLTLWGEHRCGGIIIAPNFILTAAHCLRVGCHEFSPSDLRVHAGITCKSEINNNNTFEISRIIRHPREPFVEWPGIDAALLQLSRPIPFNDTRHAINYMGATNSALFSVGNQVNTSGWGWMEPGPGGSAAECLQAVDLTIISNHLFGAPSNIITVTGTGNIRQGGCHGDSGGPLTIRTNLNEPILIGIAHSIQIANCIGTNNSNPTYFERVDQIVPWINSYVRPIIPTLSGPQTIGIDATGVFTLGNVPAGAHIVWFHSPSLQRVSNSGNSATFRASGSVCHGWVQATVNGVPSQRFDIDVNRPVVTHVLQLSSMLIVRAGELVQFRAVHNMTPVSWENRPVWRIQGHSYHMLDEWVPGMDYNLLTVRFMASGTYIVTATVANACGAETRSINVTVEGNPSAWCPVCFSPLDPHGNCPFWCWWRSTEEEVEEDDDEDVSEI